MIYSKFRDRIQAFTAPVRPDRPADLDRVFAELSDAQVQELLVLRAAYEARQATYDGQLRAYGLQFDQVWLDFSRALRAEYASWATDEQAAVLYGFAYETGHSSMDHLEGQYERAADLARRLIGTLAPAAAVAS